MRQHVTHLVASVHLLAAGPTVTVHPNTTTLPGISTLNGIVGSLLTIGLIAALAGLVLAAIVWSLGHHSSNPQLAGRGKAGVLVAFAAAILIGGAVVLTNFFAGIGGKL